MPPILSTTEAHCCLSEAFYLSTPTHCPLPRDPILACIDLEWHKPKDVTPRIRFLTEIGISTLDTRVLRSTKPGQYGVEWLCQMQAFHFRPIDCRDLHYDNIDKRRNIPLDAADKFLFGTSTFVEREELGITLTAALSIADNEATVAFDSSPVYRNIILVGQGWNACEATMIKEHIGLNLDALPFVTAIIDTQILFMKSADEEKKQKPGLARLMEEYGVELLHLHNGANDAVYTLVVLVLGTLWRDAYDKVRDSMDWERMTATFPGMQCVGEKGIEALKRKILGRDRVENDREDVGREPTELESVDNIEMIFRMLRNAQKRVDGPICLTVE